jgi:hypothetical protein
MVPPKAPIELRGHRWDRPYVLENDRLRSSATSKGFVGSPQRPKQAAPRIGVGLSEL